MNRKSIAITSEKMFTARCWINRIRIKKHKKYRVYLRALARVSNYKQTNWY